MLSKANITNTYNILSFSDAGKIGFTFLLFSRDLKITYTRKAVLIANPKELKECQMSF